MDFLEMIEWMPVAALVLGFLARTVGLWLYKVWQSNFANEDNQQPVKWNWRYLWGQLVMFALLVVVLPLIIDFNELMGMTFQNAFVYAFGAASIGRELDKIFFPGSGVNGD